MKNPKPFFPHHSSTTNNGCMAAQMPVYTYHIHTQIHKYIHTYIHTYMHTCMMAKDHLAIECLLRRIHVLSNTYTHTYIHTYIHTHIQMQADYVATPKGVGTRLLNTHLGCLGNLVHSTSSTPIGVLLSVVEWL